MFLECGHHSNSCLKYKAIDKKIKSMKQIWGYCHVHRQKHWIKSWNKVLQMEKKDDPISG